WSASRNTARAWNARSSSAWLRSAAGPRSILGQETEPGYNWNGPVSERQSLQELSEELTQDITEDLHRGLRLAGLVILAAIHTGLALPALLSGLDRYRHPWIQLAAFVLLTLIVVGDALLSRTGRNGSGAWAVTGLTTSL